MKLTLACQTLLAAALAVVGAAAHAQSFDAVRIFGPVEADAKGAVGVAVARTM